MPDRLRYVGRIVIGLCLAGVVASAQQADDLEALRRQVLARFEVVPLRTGVALVGRATDRRVEIADGLILEGGTPIPGAELRARLGNDARLVLRLSYLDNAELRALFAVPAAPTPAAPAPPPPPAIAAPPTPPAAEPPAPTRTYRRSGARIAFGKSLTVAEDEEVTDGVVAIGGRIRIAGRVRDEVVAIGGSVELLPTAEVRGDITAIGGRVTIAPGARHAGQIHHAEVRDWPGWSWPLAGWSWLDLGGATRWVTVAGTLARVALLAMAVALVALLGGSRVGRIGAAAAAAPLKSGVIGLTLQLLFVPALIVVSLGLAITIVGLPFVALLIPLALVTMFLAMLLGFAAVARAVGEWIGRRLGWERPGTVGVTLLGAAFIVLPTVVARFLGLAPGALGAAAFAVLAVGTAVEYIAWTIGLGAAAATGLGRWATAPPPLPPQLPPPFDRPADAPAPV